MKYLKIIDETITDGEGLRTSVYVSGCNHKCKGCHNPQTWDFNQGYLITEEVVQDLIKSIKNNPLLSGITFSGGDPLFTTNIDLIREFLNKYGNEFDICIYTGHSIDYVKENNISGFKFIKCGKYIPELAKDRNPGMTDTEFIFRINDFTQLIIFGQCFIVSINNGLTDTP